MKKKNETERLNDTIIMLENKRAEELKLLKEQFHLVHEGLKPINLLKSTLHEITSSPEIKNNIVNDAIGITTGYLTRKVLFRRASNPVSKVIGTLLQFAVTSFVSKHSSVIQTTGKNLLYHFLSRRKRAGKEFQHDGDGFYLNANNGNIVK